jgi:hypothetical protein
MPLFKGTISLGSIFINIAVIICFTSGISYTPSSLGIDIYWYYTLIPIYIIYLIFTNKFKVSLSNIFLFLVIIISIIINSITQNTLNFAIKQLIIFFFSYVFFKLFFEQYSMDEIIRGYFKIAKLYIGIGFIQFFLCLVGYCDLYEQIFFFSNFNNISYRLTSFDLEPSFVCYALTPFVFASIINLLENKTFYINKKWSILGVIAYLLTISPMAFLGIIIILILNYFRKINFVKLINIIPFILLVVLISIMTYSNIPVIKMKIDDTYKTLIGEKQLDEVNLSSYAFISNLRVTSNSLKDNTFFGRGLGAHEVNYDNYKTLDYVRDELNKKDANSLLLRLLSELGIFGAFIFIFFLFKYRVSFNNNLEIWILNNGIFVYFLLRLIRNGNYTIGGMFFFLILYYYSYVNSTKSSY